MNFQRIISKRTTAAAAPDESREENVIYKYDCFKDLVISQLVHTGKSHFIPLYGGLGYISIVDTSHAVLGVPDATQVTWFDCKDKGVVSVTEHESNIITATVLEGKLLLVKSDGMIVSMSKLEGRVTTCLHPLLREEGIMEAKFSSSVGDAAFLTFKNSFVLLYGGLTGRCVVCERMEMMQAQTPLLWDFCRFDKKLCVLAIFPDDNQKSWQLVRLSEDAVGKRVLKKKPRKVACEKSLTALFFEDNELVVYRGFEFETQISSSDAKDTLEIFLFSGAIVKLRKEKLIFEGFELPISADCVVKTDRHGVRMFEPFEHSVIAREQLEFEIIDGFAFYKCEDEDAAITLMNLGMFEEALRIGKERGKICVEWLKWLISNPAITDDEIRQVYFNYKDDLRGSFFLVLKECVRAERIKLALSLIKESEDGQRQKVDYYLLLKFPEKALSVEGEDAYAWEQLCSCMSTNQILALVVQHPERKASLEEYVLSVSDETLLRALYLLDDRVDELAWWYLGKHWASLEERERNIKKAKRLSNLSWTVEILEEAELYYQFLKQISFEEEALVGKSPTEAIKYLKEKNDLQILSQLLDALKVSENVRKRLL